MCREESKRKELGALKAISAAGGFLQLQRKERGTAGIQMFLKNPFGSAAAGLSDKDIANVVPDDWREGVEFFRR